MKNSIFNAVCKTRYLALLVLLIFTCGNAWGASVTWEQVAWGDITTSDVIIVTVTTSNGTYLLEHSQGTSATPKLGNTGTLTNSNANCTFNENDNVKWKKDASNRLCKASDGTKWLYTGTSNNAMRVGTSTSGNVWTLDGNYIKSNASTARYLSVYSTTDFRSYTSKQSGQVTRFYKASSATVAAPTFGVAAGTYNNNQSVTLSCATDGATIYYTSSTNGVAPADPTSSSTAYSSAITVDHDNTIIKAIAIKGGTNSTVASATYRLTCATPTFSPAEGAYVGTQSVTISSATTSANIYYTTNGSTPTTSSTLYSGAITVSSSQTIKALVTKSNYTNSAVGSAAYTITPAYTVTWKNQGSTVTTTNVASGSKPVFPDMSGESGCQTYTYFYGWAEGTWTGEVASPSTSSAVKVYKTASEMPNVTSDGVVYHAVWGDSPGGWAAASSVSVGDVIVITDKNDTKELTGIYMPSSTYIGKAEAFSTTPNGTYPLTVVTGYNSSGVALKNGDDYLLGSSSNDLSKTTTLSALSSWTLSYDGVNDDWSITNNDQTSRRIRYNGGTTPNRFCTYTSAQTGIHIWKHSAAANCVTSCCTKLGAIDGELTLTQGGNSVTISGWSDVANVGTYTVKMYKKNGGGTWDLVSGTASGGSAGTAGTRTGITSGSKSVTYTGLTVESEYKFTVQAIAGSASYCNGDETAVTEINSTDVSSTPFKFRYSIYIDNGSGSGWAHHYITPTGNTDEGSIDIDLTAHITSYQFKIAGGFSGWWGQTGTSNIPASTKWTLDGSNNVKLNTGAGGSYTFTVDYSGTTNPGVTVTFPSANQDPGYIIYYDNSVLNWSNLYYRIGNNSNCSKVDAVLVTGTDKFYKFTTPDYDNMDAWHIANNYGWTGSNSIYKTKTGDGTAITNSISFQQYVVTEDITVIPTTTHSTGGDDQNNNCQFYTINTPTSGMLTHTATIGSHTHGTINLAYTDVSGTAQNKTATTAGLAHRTKITATATPATGYLLNTFTVTPSGESAQNLVSGATDNHILAKDATFAATFTAKTYDLTLDPDGGSGSNQTVTATYDAAMPTTLKGGGAIVLPTREGYDFGGYYSAKNGGGTQYYTSAGASARTWNVDDAITLYAKWTIKSYTLTWNLDGGSITSAGTAAGSVVYGTALTAPTVEKEGYDFTGWSPAVPSTMPAANSTYTAQWSIKHYTVTWKSNGSNYGEPVDYTHGASLVLPTPNPSVPSGCSSKVFVGWTSDSEITTETSTEPSFISAGGAVTADVTYRAVFADEGAGGTKWVRKEVTTGFSLSDVSEGTWALVSSEGYAFNGTITSGHGQKTAAAATFVNNEVAALPTGACELTFTKVMDGGNIVGYTIYSATLDKYLYATKAASGGLAWQSSETSYWTVTSNNWVYEWNTAYMRVYDNTFRTYAGSSNASLWLAKKTNEVSYDNYITVCSSCTTPSGLSMSNITSTGGKVSWSGVSLSPTEGYKVAWNTSNSVPSPLNSGNSADVDADKSEYTISDLTPATQYYVFVQSKCNSTWSSSTNFYTNAKITYAAGTGASGSMDPKEVTYNAASTTVDACTFTAPSGKVFNGWVSNVAVTVNGGGSPTTTVPAGATINNLTAAITLTAQWRDLAVYHVTFSADNGTVAGGASQDVLEGGTLTFPNVTSTTCGTFSGWVEAAYDNTAAPSGATYHAVGDVLDADPSMDGKTYYAVYRVATGAPTNINDELTAAKIGVTSYEDWSGITDASAAIYAGNSAKNTTYSNSIQIRSSNSSGIVTTTSGGLAKKVTFDWVSGNTSGRVVDIYGKNSAYSSAADLYGDAASQGTKIGSIIYGTSTEVTISTDYEYIGIRSNSGAAYIGTITIQWYGSPMKYQTSPACSPVVSLTSSFSSFTYVYGSGPSASQSFTVSGANLGANLVVTAPANYEVCKTSGGTYTSSVSYTPSDGTVTDQTVYIRLAGGLNVGTYNYAAASGVSAASTGATTRTAALNGSVTRAAGAIAFTEFNAVDHYEAEMAAGAASVDVTLTVSVTGDGAVSYSRTPAAGSSAVPATTPTTTLHVTTVGTWTVTANLAAGTNYTSASTNCQVVVYYADRFYDNLHGNSTIVKRNDSGEDHYTIPSLSDESRQTSGTCSQTHYHFMGWVPEAALGSLTDDASYTAVMITSGTQAASGTNYYAVWAEE